MLLYCADTVHTNMCMCSRGVTGVCPQGLDEAQKHSQGALPELVRNQVLARLVADMMCDGVTAGGPLMHVHSP